MPRFETVVVEAPLDNDGLDAHRELDRSQPGFATAVDLDEQVGAIPGDGMAELLSRTPGLRVRSFGGLGQFSSVSIRGSSGQQVPLFMDGVPLSGSFVGAMSLGDFALDSLEVIEVYRGYIPVALGGAGMGGVINLRSRKPAQESQIDAAMGFGSFAGP